MRWLAVNEVLAFHQRQIAEHGGIDGVRDLGLLESALARPQNIEVYEPYLAGTHDEKMFRVVKDRASWFDIVMGRAAGADSARGSVATAP